MMSTDQNNNKHLTTSDWRTNNDADGRDAEADIIEPIGGVFKTG